MTRPTAEQIRQYLNYDPISGEFTAKTLRGRGRRFKEGHRMGTVDQMGYLRIYVRPRQWLAHRLAYLRLASHEINAKNSKRQVNNTSGAVGVYLHAGKWTAYITHKRKMRKLGRYADKNQAIAARKAAEIHFGFHPNHGRAA